MKRRSERLAADDAWRAIRDLFEAQSLAVLATQRVGQPYTSLVAFVAGDDLAQLFFATARATRKYANLRADSRVAMHIDSRSNQPADFHDALSVTALGRARELMGAERDEPARLYVRKHPHLADFIAAPDCALVRVDVETYYLAKQFQRVIEVPVRGKAGDAPLAGH